MGFEYSSVGRLLALYSAQDPSHSQYKLGAAEQGGGRRVKKSRLSSVSEQVSLGYLQSCDGKKARPKEEQERGRGKLDEM